MTNLQAVKLIRKYNEWRRGADNGFLANVHASRHLGTALDMAIKSLEQKTNKAKQVKK